jgi:hypothetical protein
MSNPYSKTLIAKAHMHPSFTQGRKYIAIYMLEPKEEQGWFTSDDREGQHWLTPYDGRDHSDIYKEKFITTNFIIVD